MPKDLTRVLIEHKPSADFSTESEAGDLVNPDVTTLLPEQLLQPGELIILMIKPSPLFIVLAPLRPIMVIMAVVLAFDQLAQHDLISLNRQDIALAGIGLIGLRLFWQFLDWVSRVYVLTDRRVIRVKGVVRVEVFETSLKQIQHTEALYSLRERLFGLGTISFATAGTGSVEAFWRMISKPLDVHQKLVQAISRYR